MAFLAFSKNNPIKRKNPTYPGVYVECQSPSTTYEIYIPLIEIDGVKNKNIDGKEYTFMGILLDKDKIQKTAWNQVQNIKRKLGNKVELKTTAKVVDRRGRVEEIDLDLN